jgi:hypothetical protein
MNRYLNDDSDFHIVNGKKVLKDNRVYRAKMVLMDAAPDNQRRSRIVDAAQPGDPYGTHRPGYRVFDVDDTGGRKAIADAHEAYLFDLENAWRGDAASNPTKDPDLNDPDDDEDDDERPRLRRRFQKRDPFGRESGSISEEDGDRYQARYADNDAAARDAREAAHHEYVDYITNAYKQPQLVRDQDTRAGESGLVDHDEPTHFSRPRITDGAVNCDEFAFSRPGYRMLADASVNDARETAYAEYLDYVTNAWKSNPPKDGRHGR